MKTILALLALLSLSAFAQSVRGTPPDYCKPCLLYGGDLDATNANADALTNEHTRVSSTSVYVPFFVPPGQKWTITGLFSNNMSNQIYINPAEIEWSISSGVSTGNAGTLIASGTIHATYTPTGRSWNGMTEYTSLGRLTPTSAVTLTTGVYWMTAVPVCTASFKHECQNTDYYLSDVEDVPAPNHKGTQPNDDSFLFAPSAGYIFVPTWGADGACGGIGCDKFSAGLLGYAKPSN